MHILIKKEDQCSQIMNEITKETFENNSHHYESMKTISRAYFSKHKCFALWGSLSQPPKTEVKYSFSNNTFC